ncbi:MAG TPA: hypothetical protein VG962_00015 [Steroidobacteraceae bacterium]|nr:hypothetical protein [Steroidobacteraceae bacterium]
MLEDHIRDLDIQLRQLESERYSFPEANEVFEAATHWRSLALRALAKDTRVDFPLRVCEERDLLDLLENKIQKRDGGIQRFGMLFELSRRIFDIVVEITPPSEGHMGILNILKDKFGFLVSKYGFHIVDKNPMGMTYSSGAVWIDLKAGSRPSSCCTFGPGSEYSNVGELFWIEDLLYLAGDGQYEELENDIEIGTENKLRNHFSSLAEYWIKYGHDVLINKPGIFDLLASAQSARDAQYTLRITKGKI